MRDNDDVAVKGEALRQDEKKDGTFPAIKKHRTYPMLRQIRGERI